MSMPPTFFNIMLHFVVYFVEEVEPRGPVQARWLYLLEMYMKDLKDFAQQKPILRHHGWGYLAKDSKEVFLLWEVVIIGRSRKEECI